MIANKDMNVNDLCFFLTTVHHQGSRVGQNSMKRHRVLSLQGTKVGPPLCLMDGNMVRVKSYLGKAHLDHITLPSSYLQ